MMCGGHGSAMSDGALNNNDNFCSTQKLRRHDCADGSAENQVDSASGGCRRESLPPTRGEAFTRKLSVQINNPIFYKILKYTVVYHHYEFRQIKPLAAFL